MIIENLYSDKIRTVSGLYVDVFNPDPDTIIIEDIAHSLSMQCRFGGHLPRFYSVAQHCVHCCDMISAPFKIDGLLHDASEAYILDFPKPIKDQIQEYKSVEDNLMKVIAAKFGFQYPLREEVKEVDGKMLRSEWSMLVLGIDRELFYIRDRKEAKANFLDMFNRYNPKR